MKPDPLPRASMEYIKSEWSKMANPNCRKLAAELAKQGYAANYRTIARYVAKGFVSGRRTNKVEEAAAVNNDLIFSLPEVRRLVRTEALMRDTDTGEPMPDDPFEVRRRELADKTETELRTIEQKARISFNIMFMEALSRKTDILAVMPGDISKVIVAMTDAAAAQPSLNMIAPDAGVGAKDITPASQTDLQSAIMTFKKRMG